jgi:hypothetical protein
MRAPLLAAVAALLALAFPPALRAQVTTSQYDNARSGANVRETILNPRNVNVRQFGKLFSIPVDGDVYAQPLQLARVAIAGKGTHDVVFIATEHDSVYAFDATGRTVQTLWHVSLLDPALGATPIPFRDLHCPFIQPEVGITSTPVIDAKTQTLYALARTKEGSRYVQRLHALDVRSGAERQGSPVEVRASVSGRGAGAVQGQVAFDPQRENPRASLLLVNGMLYLAWASSCDVGPYHGWVMTYDASSLRQLAAFNTTPDGGEGGIWQSDTGLAADENGNVYAATGNGDFDADRGGRSYGDTVLKFSADRALTVLDYFTPFDQKQLNANDADLGSGGPVLVDQRTGAHKHLLVIGGKGGTLYLVDRDSMGKFHAGGNSHALQTMDAGGIFGAAAFWNGTVYYIWSGSVLKVFALRNGRLALVGQAKTPFVDPGATVTISANGAKDGVAWAIESRAFGAPDRPAVLHAYDAANVAKELYASEQNSARDRAGIALRFNIPTVIAGRVYVGTKGGVDVYGLLAANQ